MIKGRNVEVRIKTVLRLRNHPDHELVERGGFGRNLLFNVVDLEKVLIIWLNKIGLVGLKKKLNGNKLTRFDFLHFLFFVFR